MSLSEAIRLGTMMTSQAFRVVFTGGARPCLRSEPHQNGPCVRRRVVGGIGRSRSV
jgi:hypothetical protein